MGTCWRCVQNQKTFLWADDPVIPSVPRSAATTQDSDRQMKWSELHSGLMKSDHFESNPGINLQKAPSSGNCKHCRTAPETGILAGPSLPGKQIFAEIYGFILVSPEHTGGLNNHKPLFKVAKCNKQSKGLIPDLQTTTDSKEATL